MVMDNNGIVNIKCQVQKYSMYSTWNISVSQKMVDPTVITDVHKCKGIIFWKNIWYDLQKWLSITCTHGIMKVVDNFPYFSDK